MPAPPAPTTTEAVLDRALAFTWAVAETMADDVERIDQGTVLSTAPLSGAWSINALRLEGPHPGLTLTVTGRWPAQCSA